MASNLKFSVVLEAVTTAFNKAVNDARSNYRATTSSITGDSERLTASTAAVSAKLKDVFAAKNAGAVTAALKATTAELNKAASGAQITSDQMRQIGTVGKQALGELGGALKVAQNELKNLALTKASPADIDTAKLKVVALKREINNAHAEYGRFQVAASTAMRRAAADTQEAANRSRAAGRAIYEALNIRTGGALRTELAQLTSQLSAFRAQAGIPAAEVRRVTTAAQAQIMSLKAELRGVGPTAVTATNQLAGIGKAALAFTGVTAGFMAIKSGIESIIGTTVKFETVMKQLEFATGSARQAGVEFEYVRQVSRELGLELETTSRGYAKLAASTKGTALEGEATRKVFLGVASAAASLGLSAADTDGVIMALAQIASKGTVNMEELRQQLGERLPGAMQVAAKSMGVTTGELIKMVEGGLDSVTFLKAFGPAMVEAFGPTAAKNATTLQGTINKLRNEFFEIMVELGQGSMGQAVAGVFNDIATAVGAARTALNSLDPSTSAALNELWTQMYGIVTESFGALISLVSDASELLGSLADYVGAGLGAFDAADPAAKKVGFLTRTLQGVTIILGTIKDGISGLSIGFDLVTGVAQKFFSYLALAISKVTFGDVSKSMLQFSQEMDRASAASFGRAETKALSFQSAAVGALNRAAEAAESSGARVGASASAAASKAGKAYAQTGESAQDAFRKAELAAAKAGGAIRVAGMDGVEVMVGVSTAGTEVSDAFRAMAKEVGVTVPTAARTVEQLGAVMGAVAAHSTKLARDIATSLPEAIKKLNGPELKAFETAFVGGMVRAGASAEQLKQTMLTIATQGAKVLGVDLGAALTGTSKGFQDNRVILDGFIKDFDRLKANGVNASLLVEQSLGAMLDKAKNPAELRELITAYEQMGRAGKIGGEALAAGLDKAKAKLDEITPGINSVAEAFRTFGLKTREESQALARNYGEAFDKLRFSGKASASDLRTAFTSYAEAAVAANGGVVDTLIQAKAASLGLKVEMDETGKVIVSAMTGAAGAADTVRQKIDEGTEALRRQGDLYQQMIQRYEDLRTLSADYSERQIEQLERENELRQRGIDLENKRLNIDAQGFSLDKTGKQTVNAGGETWLSILNTLKGFGVTDDKAARRIASEFTDSRGEVPYFSNPGQKKYQADTLSMGILKAATSWVMQNPEGQQAASASGASTDRSTIEFKAPSGESATVATTAGTTVEGVMAVLKSAGAVSVR